MEKVKDIIEQNPGHMVVIAHRTGRYRNANNNEIIADSGYVGGKGLFLRQDYLRGNMLKDLWAYDYDFVGSDSYEGEIENLGSIFFEEFVQSDDPDEMVLVIWLSHFSYRILTDSSLHSVRDFRTEYIGQYHECIVIKPKRAKSSPDEDYYGNDDYDDYDNYEPAYCKPGAEVVQDPLDIIDKMWAMDAFLLGEKDLDDMPYILDDEPEWWWEESFEEHYSNAEAKILFVVLA